MRSATASVGKKKEKEERISSNILNTRFLLTGFRLEPFDLRTLFSSITTYEKKKEIGREKKHRRQSLVWFKSLKRAHGERMKK